MKLTGGTQGFSFYRIAAVAACFFVLSASPARALSNHQSSIKKTVDLDAERHNAYSLRLQAPGLPLSHMELRVTPVRDNGNDVARWDVQLMRFSPEAGTFGDNLLADEGIGLQPFMFVPDDAEGHGVYPRQRELRGGGIRCVITVLGGQTQTSQTDPHPKVFKSLRLEIELEADTKRENPTP